jgi:hypothetical protein
MSKSQIFYTAKYKIIEKAIVELLNSQPDFMSTQRRDRRENMEHLLTRWKRPGNSSVNVVQI